MWMDRYGSKCASQHNRPEPITPGQVGAIYYASLIMIQKRGMKICNGEDRQDEEEIRNLTVRGGVVAVVGGGRTKAR